MYRLKWCVWRGVADLGFVTGWGVAQVGVRETDCMGFILRMRGWLGIVLLLVWGLTAAGASRRSEFSTPFGDWLVRTWESEEGLPENSATAMVQTPDHYLWFGTFNGLVRFDGVQFAVFDTSNTAELPSSAIVNLHLDRAGRLWVSTLKGLVWREGTRWGIPAGVRPDDQDPVRTFAERPNGEILLTTFSGGVLEFAGGALRALPRPPGVPGQGYLGTVDDQGRWWVVQSGFIGRWMGQDWDSMVPAADLAPVGSTGLGCTPAREGGLWVLIGAQLRRYLNGTEVSRRRIPDLPEDIWSLYEDSRGNLWVCTISHGVMQVLPDDRVYVWNETTGSSYDGVRFVFEDLERNLWIGTSGGGLMRFKSKRFTTFGPEQGLTERVVKTVWPSTSGGLWIGSYGGSLFHLSGQDARPVPLPMPYASRRYIQSVRTDQQGRTWLGTFGGGLSILDDSGWNPVPSNQTGGGNIIALFEDSLGRMWISGGQGIAMLEGETFRVFGAEANTPKGAVHAFGEDRPGRIWMSNFDGVFRLEGDRWNEVLPSDGKPFREVTCFLSESDDTWWMGTLSDGLIRWRGDQVRRINRSQGLPVRGVYAMLSDGLGNFWMASGQGIARATRESLNGLADGEVSQFSGQLLDPSDGLASGECPGGQQPIAARDAQGRLWFATLKGVAMVDPAQFQANTVLPAAIIESLVYTLETRSTSAGIPVERRVAGPFEGELELPPGSQRIEVHYTAPSFGSPNKVRFQYRLEGGDDVWRGAGVRRVAYFENLAPGRYRFQVKASNDDGLWNPEPTTLAFQVRPHFWQTPAFRGVMGLVLVGATLLWNRQRQRQLRETSDHQARFTRQLIESQEAERARIARELHDDLCQRLARLAIDTGQVEMAMVTPTERRALGEVREGLVRISEDVHELSYGLHPSILVDLGLVEALKAEGERLSRRNPVEIQFRVSGVPDVVPPDPALCLFRVAEEALHNVVRHANARHVEVSLRAEDGGLQLAIQDDGIGFDPRLESRRPSLGLTGMRERITLLGGTLDIESAPGSGSLIVAWLPLPPPTS